MPWTAADVDGFKKGLSRKQKKKWVNVANGALESCEESGGKDCEGRAVRIANSKFEDVFNPVIGGKMADRIEEELKQLFSMPDPGEVRAEVRVIFHKAYAEARNSQGKMKEDSIKSAWTAVHKAGWFKNKEEKWVRRKDFDVAPKKFQNKKDTPPDPRDGHVHEAAFDEDGNGGTSEAGDTPHVHSVFGFKVQPYYYFDPEKRFEYVSVHPGSLAFADLGEIEEMEIFRPGTHNGDEFTEEDLEEIAGNFAKLKDEVRPKLKITHREKQDTIAGLASYGDVVDVFLKKIGDGTKRLFAKIANVPKQVMDFIKERRFPERSIEIYPEFKLGVKEDSPVYRNVLKAIALLGHEMPAVTGMAPVKLEECLECQGTACFRESTEEKKEEVSKELELAFSIMEKQLTETREEVKR